MDRSDSRSYRYLSHSSHHTQVPVPVTKPAGEAITKIEIINRN